MTSRLEIQLDTPEVTPGAWVRGRVRALEDLRSRRLLVKAHYWERTGDKSAIGRTVDGPVLHEGDLVGGAVYEFAIQVPPDALPGYRSENGRLSWEVEARSDERGLDSVERAEFEVLVGASGHAGEVTPER